MERAVVPGTVYRHFKNKLYQIITVARHSETGEELVVYQALYGDFGVYARPKSMFLSEVDKEKYPNVTQKYRFEAVNVKMNENVNIEVNASINTDIKANIKDDEDEIKSDNKDRIIIKDSITISEESDSNKVNSDLMDFLNADEYKEKIDVINKARKRLDERILDNMAAAIDQVLPDGDCDIKFNALLQNLRTLEKYELKRR